MSGGQVGAGSLSHPVAAPWAGAGQPGVPGKPQPSPLGTSLGWEGGIDQRVAGGWSCLVVPLQPWNKTVKAVMIEEKKKNRPWWCGLLWIKMGFTYIVSEYPNPRLMERQLLFGGLYCSETRISCLWQRFVPWEFARPLSRGTSYQRWLAHEKNHCILKYRTLILSWVN